MTIWSGEIKELEKLFESVKENLPPLGKELGQLLKTEDANVVMLYSRRCLELIVTDLCECELKRPRKTEPLKGIIDKLNSEEKVPSHIIASMHGLNSLATFGTHPKDFDHEQVRPVLNNLSVVFKWYLKYKGFQVFFKSGKELEDEIENIGKQLSDSVVPEKSIAVLPFRNDSQDEENTYFVNGLMEETLNNLQKIKELRVISRTSVEQYRNTTKPIPQIAKELGVNYIVEGSGQKYGRHIRLRTQLIMATKESHLWGDSFQQEVEDASAIFKAQSNIAEAIANELKAVITPAEKQLIEKIPTKDIEAYEAFLKGRFYMYKFGQNDLETAIKYFELAWEKDPEYAPAHAGIAAAWATLSLFGYTSPEIAGPKIQESLMKALELDSTLAEVQYTLAGITTWAMWDWTGGEEAFKKTISINRNHAEAHAYYSHLLLITGRPENEAMDHINIALKLDPLNPLIWGLYGVDLIITRRYDESINACYEALRIDPSNMFAASGLGEALCLSGRFEEGLEKLKLYHKIMNMQDSIEAIDRGIEEGDHKKAFQYLGESLEKLFNTSYWSPFEISQRFAAAGNKDKVLHWLEVGFEKHDPGLPYLCWPFFDLVRDEPRFREIAHKMNLPYKQATQ